MTNKEFREAYKLKFGHIISWREAKKLYDWSGEIKDMNKCPRKTEETAMKPILYDDCVPYIELGTTWKDCSPYPTKDEVNEKEGINPMYNTAIAPTAAATIITADPASAQREYLRERVNRLYRDFRSDLHSMFGRYAPANPKTAQQLIDAIKNGKYELDEKKIKRMEAEADEFDYDGIEDFGYGPFFGLKFTDYPGFDSDGYDKASKELADAHTALMDIIAIKSADDALTALQAFEKWEPSNKPATKH